MTTVGYIVAAAAFVIALVIGFPIGIQYRKKVAEKEISPKCVGHATHNKKDHNSLNDCVKPNFFHTISPFHKLADLSTVFYYLSTKMWITLTCFPLKRGSFISIRTCFHPFTSKFPTACG